MTVSFHPLHEAVWHNIENAQNTDFMGFGGAVTLAGPRLNELTAQKRRLAGELALRPEDNPAITVTDGGAGFRQLVRKLQEELREGEQGSDEAAELVRGLAACRTGVLRQASPCSALRRKRRSANLLSRAGLLSFTPATAAEIHAAPMPIATSL
jgi:hypothetical protein